MQITILKSKIHTATVTQSNVKYQGSITIDSQLMKKVDILPYEKVLVTNISRGTRLETYVISGNPGSGIIGLNGAAALLGKIGDKITVMAFANVTKESARRIKPKIIVLGRKNAVLKTR